MTPTSFSVEILPHRDPAVANQIHELLQAAYKVEGRLLGLDDFPPLRRTRWQILGAPGCFYGYLENGALLGVAEIEFEDDSRVADIASFVVAPASFRRGVGQDLVRRVLREMKGVVTAVTVSTATANAPALGLYRKCGFRFQNNWQHDADIAMVTLVHDLTGA